MSDLIETLKAAAEYARKQDCTIDLHIHTIGIMIVGYRKTVKTSKFMSWDEVKYAELFMFKHLIDRVRDELKAAVA